MSALTTAQAELDQAKGREQDAKVAHDSARAHADSLRAQLTAGKGASVSAADLAAADAQVEYGRLALEGARAPLADLTAALQRAKAEAVCDEFVTLAPIHAASLLDAIDGVAAALVPVASAAATYDQFVAHSASRLEKVAPVAEQPLAGRPPYVGPNAATTVASPFVPDAKAPEPERPKAEPFRRLAVRHLGATTVDRIPVVPCAAAAQLAAVVLPAFRELGASQALIDYLKQLAAAAPTLPAI